MLDLKQLQPLLKLLSPKEQADLVLQIAKSGAQTTSQLENHFYREGRRVAESLATKRSRSGDSIYDLKAQLEQHIQTVTLVAKHLDKIPREAQAKFKKVAKAIIDEYDAFRLYDSIQKEHFILGLLPKRLIDKFINLDTVETKVKSSSEALKEYFDYVIKLLLQQNAASGATNKPQNRNKVRSAPISIDSLARFYQMTSTKKEGLSSNAKRVMERVWSSINKESEDSNPDLDVLKEDVVLGITEIKSKGLNLEGKEIRSIQILLHPDKFSQESEEVKSIANGLSAMFNQVFA